MTKPNKYRIPVAAPVLGAKELEYVSDCVRSGWVSSLGEYVKRFESDFADYCGVAHAVATHNGTVALHLVLAALGIGPGDEVIVPALTFVATANAVRYTGATPVFVDSEEESWNLDPQAVAQAVTPRTRAIVPVHLYGHPAQMDALLECARANHLTLVEDAAEAHGARYRGKRVGSLGDVAVFSFYGNKIITTGEGGMVLTDDENLIARCLFLENQAKSATDPYWHSEIGFNYRMTNMQAALGVAQLERIGEFITARLRNATHYRRRLTGVPGLTLPPQAEWAENVYWMFSVLVDETQFGVDRKQVMAALARRGIETRPLFYPLNILPMYDVGQRLPVAERIGRTGINLPSGSGLTLDEVDVVCDSLIEIHETGE